MCSVACMLDRLWYNWFVHDHFRRYLQPCLVSILDFISQGIELTPPTTPGRVCMYSLQRQEPRFEQLWESSRSTEPGRIRPTSSPSSPHPRQCRQSTRNSPTPPSSPLRSIPVVPHTLATNTLVIPTLRPSRHQLITANYYFHWDPNWIWYSQSCWNSQSCMYYMSCWHFTLCSKFKYKNETR